MYADCAHYIYDAYLLPPGANFGGKGERQAERRTQGLAKTDEWAGDLVSALLIGDGVFGEHHVQRAEEKLSLLRLRFVPYKLPILVSIFYQFAHLFVNYTHDVHRVVRISAASPECGHRAVLQLRYAHGWHRTAGGRHVPGLHSPDRGCDGRHPEGGDPPLLPELRAIPAAAQPVASGGPREQGDDGAMSTKAERAAEIRSQID